MDQTKDFKMRTSTAATQKDLKYGASTPKPTMSNTQQTIWVIWSEWLINTVRISTVPIISFYNKVLISSIDL